MLLGCWWGPWVDPGIMPWGGCLGMTWGDPVIDPGVMLAGSWHNPRSCRRGPWRFMGLTLVSCRVGLGMNLGSCQRVPGFSGLWSPVVMPAGSQHDPRVIPAKSCSWPFYHARGPWRDPKFMPGGPLGDPGVDLVSCQRGSQCDLGVMLAGSWEGPGMTPASHWWGLSMTPRSYC